MLNNTNQDKIDILEMLLWQNHIEGIPTDVYHRLKEKGFLVPSSTGGLTWSQRALNLNSKFNKNFYEKFL